MKPWLAGGVYGRTGGGADGAAGDRGGRHQPRIRLVQPGPDRPGRFRLARAEDSTAKRGWSDTPPESTIPAGYIEGAQRYGLDLRPTVLVSATPKGPVTDEAFDTMTAEMIRRSSRAIGRIDGVLLALHGAMVVESHPHGDAELVRRVREARGAAHAHRGDARFPRQHRAGNRASSPRPWSPSRRTRTSIPRSAACRRRASWRRPCAAR